MSVAEVEHYTRRARDFLRGMKSFPEEESCQNSAALLAIHSAVSYADALRVGLGNDSLWAENHRDAARVLRKLCTARRMEDQRGITHLEHLISKKSLVAYGDRTLPQEQFRQLSRSAERFAAWADKVGSELGIEGWTL